MLSNLFMNPTSSDSLFNKMNPDFLASSLLKRQVTYRAGLLSPWIEASCTASLAPLKKSSSEWKSSNDLLQCNTTCKDARWHERSLGRCNSQPICRKQVKEKRKKQGPNVSVYRCPPGLNIKGFWIRSGQCAKRR